MWPVGGELGAWSLSPVNTSVLAAAAHHVDVDAGRLRGIGPLALDVGLQQGEDHLGVAADELGRARGEP